MLGRGTVDDGIHIEGLDYAYAVHLLRDLPAEPLLAELTLAPFATFADVPDGDRAAMFRRVLDRIAAAGDAEARAVFGAAAVELAGLRLSEATIDATWKESDMAMPSLLQKKHEQGFEQGIEAGREDGFEQVAATLLRHRFGADDRIEGIAQRLARLGAEECVSRIEQATGLDDLTG